MIHVTGIFNFDCEYLEQIAERLTKFYGREVLVSDYESTERLLTLSNQLKTSNYDNDRLTRIL